MTTITDPQAIKFCNEEIRPLCEEIRALVAKIGSVQTRWFGGVNVLFPNDSSAIDDDRDIEGVSRLVGSDVNSVMGIAIAMVSASNADIIEKPTVRSIQAS